jgi:hypothetical protein
MDENPIRESTRTLLRFTDAAIRVRDRPVFKISTGKSKPAKIFQNIDWEVKRGENRIVTMPMISFCSEGNEVQGKASGTSKSELGGCPRSFICHPSH